MTTLFLKYQFAFLFLFILFYEVSHVSGCSSDKDCQKQLRRSVCKSGRCECDVHFEPNSRGNRCTSIPKNRRTSSTSTTTRRPTTVTTNSPDESGEYTTTDARANPTTNRNSGVTTPNQAVPTSTPSEFVRVVTGHVPDFSFESTPCPGLISNTGQNEQCKYGGQCVKSQSGQNYCLCASTQVGSDCSRTYNKATSTFDGKLRFQKDDVYYEYHGSGGFPDQSVIGRHQIDTWEKCVATCAELKRCESVQFGKIGDKSVCVFVDVILHPQERPDLWQCTTAKTGWRIGCCTKSAPSTIGSLFRNTQICK